MSSNLPRISIILGNYNYGRWVERAVISVLEQNYPNLELLVIDDGSTDNSVAVLEKYKARYDYWNPRNNQGHFSWIKEASERATGVLINWLCSDDYLAPGALLRVGKAYQEEQSVDVITGKATRWSGEGQFECDLEPFIPVSFEDVFRKGICLPQPSTFIKTDLFRKSLPPVGLVNILVDTATYLKLWMEKDSTLSCHIIPEVLAHVQNHPGAQTVSQGLRTKEEIKKIYSFLASQTSGFKSKLLLERNRLHNFRDQLELIAANSNESIWKLINLLVQYPEIIYQRSFWGAVKKKLY
ncbi:MAG: glycosyltransferase [Pseudomonadota bacterium]